MILWKVDIRKNFKSNRVHDRQEIFFKITIGSFIKVDIALWFNPSWQLSTIQLLTCFPTVGWRRIWRVNVRKKVISWYKTSLIIKEIFKKGGGNPQTDMKIKPKKNKRCKWKQLLTTNQLMPCHSQATPSPPTSTPVLLLSLTSYGLVHPFGQLGSAGMAVSPLDFLHTPSLLTVRARQEDEKALTLCKHCLPITCPCVINSFQHKCKT